MPIAIKENEDKPGDVCSATECNAYDQSGDNDVKRKREREKRCQVKDERNMSE